MWVYHRVMSPKDADEMAHSVDPDQTAPVGTFLSGFTLFAQAYLSDHYGTIEIKGIDILVLTMKLLLLIRWNKKV